ncbi:MAG: 16S rRNA (cytosine(1402)-N(4))-methyltransferase RsmH [Patescibacteria group bacterium]
MNGTFHEPVLLNEVLHFLDVKPGKKYIDCTLGDAGHTIEILKLGGKVLGFDYSEESISRAENRISQLGLKENFKAVQKNFKNIDTVASENDFDVVEGVLFDLGYSSYQLDKGEKGLSFLRNENLDMRLSNEFTVTAADLINALPETELVRLFRVYGEEILAKRFASAIVKARRLKKLTSTKDLTDILVKEAPPGYEHKRIHPATRVFQALRIAVNDELESLKVSLPRAAHLLRSPLTDSEGSILPGGRMLVITFHSLEDRVVKNFGQSARHTIKLVNEKLVVPGEKELEFNRRSRSAKMRVFEKI